MRPKKIFTIMISLVMLLSMTLTGCGKKATTDNSSSESLELSLETESTADLVPDSSTADVASTTAAAISADAVSNSNVAVPANGSAKSEAAVSSSEVVNVATPGNTSAVVAPAIASYTPTTNEVANASANKVAAELAAVEAAVATEPDTSVSSTVQATTSAPVDQKYRALLEAAGFSYVDSLASISSVFSQALAGSYTEDSYCYRNLVAPAGMFDSVAETSTELHNASLNYHGATVSSNPLLAEMAYVKNTFGFDYQKYITDGINCILFIKTAAPSHGFSFYEIVAVPDSSSTEMAAARSKAKSIAATLNYGTVYDKIKNVHDYLCANVVYDTTLSRNDIHTAYGALVNGVAVCDGYAEGFKMILDELGITTNVVMNYIHEWNEVYFNGNWYFVDCTNDDNSKGIIYMNLMIGRDILTASVPMAVTTIENNKKYYYIFANDRIDYYGYMRNANSSIHSLAPVSYGQNVVVYNN